MSFRMEKNNSHLKTSTLFGDSQAKIASKHSFKRGGKSKENVKPAQRSKDRLRADVGSEFEILYQECKKKCRLFLEKIPDEERKEPVKRSLQEVLSLIKLERINKNDYMKNVSPLVNSKTRLDADSFHTRMNEILSYAKRIHNTKMCWFQSYEKLLKYLSSTSSFEMCIMVNHLIMNICHALGEQDLQNLLKKLDRLMSSERNSTQNNPSRRRSSYRNDNHSNSRPRSHLCKNNNANGGAVLLPGGRIRSHKFLDDLSPVGIRRKSQPWKRRQPESSVSAASLQNKLEGTESSITSSSYSDVTSVVHSNETEPIIAPRRMRSQAENRGRNNNHGSSSIDKREEYIRNYQQEQRLRQHLQHHKSANNSNYAGDYHTSKSIEKTRHSSRPVYKEEGHVAPTQRRGRSHAAGESDAINKVEQWRRAEERARNDHGDASKDDETATSDHSNSASSCSDTDSDSSDSTASSETYVSEKKSRKKGKKTKKEERSRRSKKRESSVSADSQGTTADQSSESASGASSTSSSETEVPETGKSNSNNNRPKSRSKEEKDGRKSAKTSNEDFQKFLKKVKK